MRFEDVDSVLTGFKYMTTQQGRQLYDLIVEHRLSRVLELGFAYGKSSCFLAAAVDELGPDGHVLTLDRLSARSWSPKIFQLLDKCGLTERVTPVFADVSYT